MRIISGWTIGFVAFCAWTMVSGCKLTFDAGDKAFKCESDNDCTSGYRCSQPIPGTTVRICVDPTKTPDVIASNDFVSPPDSTGEDTTPPQDTTAEDGSVFDALADGVQPKDVSEDLIVSLDGSGDQTQPTDTSPSDVGPPKDGGGPTDSTTVDAITVDAIGPDDTITSVDSVVSTCKNDLACVQPPICTVPLLSQLGGVWKVSVDEPSTFTIEQTAFVCMSEAPFTYQWSLAINGGIVIKVTDEKATETEIELKELSFNYAICSASFSVQSVFSYNFKGTLTRSDSLLTIVPPQGSAIPIGCASVVSNPNGGWKLVLRVAFADIASKPQDMPDDFYNHLLVTITFVSQ